MSSSGDRDHSGKVPDQISGPKRSFDVAFLAGKDENVESKSAFQKVSRKSDQISQRLSNCFMPDESRAKEEFSILRANQSDNRHFPALRKLLDVRNSIQSLEEDPTLEDAVLALNTDEKGRDRPKPSLSPNSATAMASLLSSPLLFPVTPSGSSNLSTGPSGLPDMSAGLAALLLPSPSAASLSGMVPSNTCAICGVTFRMTSDLVYHMRTHHARSASESRSVVV